MDQASLIAWLALGISALGFVVSLWSSIVSHRALSHTKNSYEEEKRIAFVRERAALLEVISESIKIINTTRIEIGALKVTFEAQSLNMQAMLVNYTGLFTDYLPAIENGLRQLTTLWSEVAEWEEKNGIHTLVNHQARFHALIHEDQVAHDQALHCINVFKEKLELAMRGLKNE